MTNKISIGGDAKKDHIHVEGLQAKEFFVVQQGNQVVLLDGQSMTYKTAFSEYAEKVHTSNSKISLVIGLKADDIKCK